MKSLHQTALFTKQLATELNKKCAGCVINQIYSNSKTQLIIETDKDDLLGKYWVLDFSTNQLIFTFPQRVFNPSRGHLLQFKSLHGKEIEKIDWIKNERAIDVITKDGQHLYLGIYGRRADVIHQNQDGIENFRNFLHHVPKEQPLNLEVSNWGDFWDANRFLIFNDIEKPFNEETALELYQQQFALNLGLVNNVILPKEHDSQWLEEIDTFGKQLLRNFQQERKEKEKAQRLAKHHKQIKQKLAKAKNKMLTLEGSNRFQLWGDVIMSNLHSISNGVKKQFLMDFVSGQEIEVPFVKDLSPVETANKYYQKAKNAHKEITFLEQKIKQLEDKLKSETPPPINQIQKKQQHALPYWEFQHNGFEIRVGKSAEKNDDLIRNHSHKHDTWLHAKDVAGSHVLIRNPNNLPIPKETLEYTASLAAKYSKSKGQTLAAVIYTPRKYVRKNKRLLAGQVILEKEEVILVKPAE